MSNAAAEGLATPDFSDDFGFSAGYVEKVWADYMSAPETISEEWRRYFEARFGPSPAAGRASADVDTPVVDSSSPAPNGAATQGRSATVESSTESGPAEPPPGAEALRGVAAKIAKNMAASLDVPTATSFREVPVKVLEENRRLINQHLKRAFRGKASFTHLIAWAMVQAVREVPALRQTYVERDGKAYRQVGAAVNLGIAVDIEGRDGRRSLVVPNIKDSTNLSFGEFFAEFNALLGRARHGKLTPQDFADTTCTLTNPGMIGTISSLPRLMPEQAFILATGSIGVPAAYAGMSESTLSELGVSKIMAMTCTYDHRVIQGAESGAYLARIHELLAGEHAFYETIFRDLGIPHQPFRFGRDRRAAPGSPLRDTENMERAARVQQFIRAYRVRGYLLADLDPLEYELRIVPELEMSTYGLTIWDLDREFFTSGVTEKPMAKLREIVEILRDTYCSNIGVEYMHIADPEQKEWLRSRMERQRNREELEKDTMVAVLDALVEAEAFERFLHTRFVGHKRFSLEGGETLVPVLETILHRAGEAELERIVFGMAHRGRLNVLAHVLSKPLTKIFSEFEGWIDPQSTQGSGDVKYHLGASGPYRAPNGHELTLELASNPSHLEAVDPVVEGMARARQEISGSDDSRERILPVLIHGDAAFAGQGVVPETLQMSQLPGYRTGGTVHVVVNNQIGYTTLPDDARSTPYCSDVAKAIQAPVFHVNGDDPLAAVRMMRLAFEYRAAFGRDVVLDIVCYRRHGHNEGDEPSYTQPLLYQKIESHPSVREIYQDYLVRAGVLTEEEADGFTDRMQARLKESLDEVRTATPPPVELDIDEPEEIWAPNIETAVDADRLTELIEQLNETPPGFTPHPKVVKILERRVASVRGESPIDFSTGEALAFATLVTDGVPIRLAGQDSGRGTFSQRHSVLLDVTDGNRHIPLNFLAADQAKYLVIDSLLSEEAALGFEYGYSVAHPRCLTIWEAQFGDFCNGAQIQIDQFISSGEEKWGQHSGLVMMLPHGYDGQGPEHSSARLERFLQLCAENNMRVSNPTTPGQIFHLLRQQALDDDKKPLVIMTPKSLLRMKVAGSELAELAEGRFAEVIPTDDGGDSVRRVVFCSGKVYYDLLAAWQKGDRSDVALVRVELLYPWPDARIADVLARYPNADQLVWCQEEPANMGPWQHARFRLPHHVEYAGRRAAASPATGSLQRHKAEQARLVAAALGEPQ